MNTASGFKTNVCSVDGVPEVIAFTLRMKNDYGVGFLPQEKEALLSKYRQEDPSSSKLNLFVLRDENEQVVGCTGYLPFKGLFKSKRVDGFIADDAFIEPSLRQSLPGVVPLFARCYESLIRKDKQLALACPVTIDRANDFKRVQWASFCWLYRFRHLSIAGLAPDFNTKIAIKRVNSFDQSVEKFFLRISEQHDFLLNSDVAFLNWKYFHCLFSDNIVLVAEDDGEMMGYIVFKQRDGDIHIVDITVDLNHHQLIAMLMHAGFDFCRNRQVSITFSYASHYRYIDILKRAGFECCLEVECLFFKVGLVLYSSIEQSSLSSSDPRSYHFNGYLQ